MKKFLAATWVGFVSLFALVFVAYSNAFSGAFLYDDEFLIERNSFLRSWSHLGDIFMSSSTGGAGHIDSFYRPLQGVLYLVVFQIAGQTPWAFHFLNIFIHALNAVMVFKLGTKLKLAPLWCWLAAAVWALHPVHTEAVTYMSATADSLYSFFCLLAIFVLLPDFTPKKMAAAVALMFLGVLSKESAIVIPALAVAALFYVSEKRLDWKTYRKLWPLWVTAGVYLILRRTVLDFNNSFDFYKTTNIYTENIHYRFFTFLATLPNYFVLLFRPVHLHMDRGFPVFVNFFDLPVLVGLAMLLMGLGWLVYSKGRRGLLGAFAILWYLAAHAPHMGVLLPVNSLFLEHWLYLPTIGFFLAFFAFAGRNFPKVALAASVIVLGAEAWATYRQNEIWQNPISFYRNILEFEPRGSARVHNNLAMAITDTDLEGAIRQYRIAIEIEDRYPQTHHNLGMLLIKQGKVDEGIAELKRAIAINPSFFYSYQILAELYRQMGQPEEQQRYQQLFEQAKGKFGQ